MIQNRNKVGILIGILSIIYCLSWHLQSHLLISWDVSWLLQVSRRLLEGGQYGRDFFEINPPLILYLYAPVIILSKFMAIQPFILFRIYVLILATGSLFISYSLLQKNIASENNKIHYLLFIMLGIIYLLLPMYELGQREHLFILLMTPYVLLMGVRIQLVDCPRGQPNGERLTHLPLRKLPSLESPRQTAGNKFKGLYYSSKMAFFIGMVAGIGFALKPFFLLTWLSLEIYAYIRTKHSFKLFRPETVGIYSVLILYGLVIVFLHQAYLIEVVPRVSQFYYQGISSPWQERIAFAPAIFCVVSLLFFVSTYAKNTQPILSTLLAIVVVCHLGLYFIQGTLWYYHILPAFAYSLLLLVLAIVPIVLWNDDSVYWISGGLGLLMVVFLCNKVSTLWTSLILDPILFFGLLAVISMGCIYYLSQSLTAIFKEGIALVICLAIGFWFAQLTDATSWYRWEFVLTIILLMLFLSLYSMRSYYKNVFAFVVLAVLAFAFPSYYVFLIFNKSLYFAKQEQTLISFLKEHAHHKAVYFFSTVAFSGFPAVDYAQAMTFTRTAALGWLPEWVKTKAYSEEVKVYFINRVWEDLQKSPPAWIFVDVSRDKPYLNQTSFDYLTFFSEDPKFRKFFSEYRYRTTLDGGVVFKLAAYERVKLS